MVTVERARAAQGEGLGSKLSHGGSPAPPAIEIRLNGDPRRIPAGTTVAGLLRLLGIQGDRVAVELNRAIVRRPDWEAAAIGHDAAVEVVHFVGGG